MTAAAMLSSSFQPSARVIRLHAQDDVVISLDQLVPGTHIESEGIVPWQISVVT